MNVSAYGSFKEPKTDPYAPRGTVTIDGQEFEYGQAKGNDDAWWLCRPEGRRPVTIHRHKINGRHCCGCVIWCHQRNCAVTVWDCKHIRALADLGVIPAPRPPAITFQEARRA